MQWAEPQHPGLDRQQERAEKRMPMAGRPRGDCRKAIVHEGEIPDPGPSSERDLPEQEDHQG